MLKGFFTILGMSFIPSKYHDLVYMRKRVVLKYLFFLLLFVTIITSFFYIPHLKLIGNQLDGEFNKFDKFQLNADVVTNEPARFGIITIDSQLPREEASDVGGILFTREIVQVNLFDFVPPSVMDIGDWKDVLRNRDTIKANIILITVLLAPYFFVLYFLLSLVKYIIYVLVASVVMLILFRTFQQEAHFYKLLRICGFSSVWLMLELFLRPTGAPWFIYSLIPLILYFVFVFITNMYIESTSVIKDRKQMEAAETEIDDVFRSTKIPGLGKQDERR